MRVLAVFMALLCLAGCGTREPGEGRVSLVSRAFAEQIGAQGYAEELTSARQSNTVDKDPEQVLQVRTIMQRLIAEATRRYPMARDWPWEIHVLESDSVNAYCAPGGKMMVLSGLLRTPGMNQDRLATVIGHEISHALLEHSRSSLARNWLLQSGMWIVAKSLKLGVVRGQSALEGLHTVFLPMDRNQERDADTLGLELMARAGFNPVSGVEFWQGSAHGSAQDEHLAGFVSTHPTDAERLTRLGEMARRWRGGQANDVGEAR
jgi:predicted Zn-dependent protease